MPWTTPTQAELRTMVRRDLRDTGPKYTFTDNQIIDYVNEGIIELTRAKPVEDHFFIHDASEQNNLGKIDVWLIWLRGPGTYQEVLPPLDENSPTQGWMYYSGTLSLGRVLQARFDALVESDPDYMLSCWGYRARDIFRDDAEDVVADFIDAEDEVAVRRYSRWAGYRALDGDRALFQQWQTQANNSDVSPTQLTQMLATAEQEWDHLRRKIMLPRRVPIGAR